MCVCSKRLIYLIGRQSYRKRSSSDCFTSQKAITDTAGQGADWKQGPKKLGYPPLLSRHRSKEPYWKWSSPKSWLMPVWAACTAGGGRTLGHRLLGLPEKHIRGPLRGLTPASC